MKIRLGNGPDSWGVWFPQDPDQVPWDRFLTDVAGAGYRWIELGPYGDLRTGEAVAPAVLTDVSWRQLVGTLDHLGRLVRDRYGVALTVHPHVDTHIETTEQTERMLADTDTEAVFVCLDTGHFAYRGG